MAYDRFLIAPFKTGLENDLEPWLLPEDAFEIMEDAYVFRGRVKKRFGYNLLNDSVLSSRLRILLGQTDGSGNFSVTVPGAVFKEGQLFSISTVQYTVPSTGTPVALLVSSGGSSGTYNTTTGALSITGGIASTDVYFYPAEPVMGFGLAEAASVNDELTIAFDTQFAYFRTGNAWDAINSTNLPSATDTWTSSNSQFFWTTNWLANPVISNGEPFLFVTNNKENIRYIQNSTISNSTGFTNLNPTLRTAVTLTTASIVLPFRDRLIALNTTENISAADQNFGNRCRFSQNGDPTATDAWREDIPGRGGFIDASTTEDIITAEFIKDRLIVFFERSTWELVYTGNEVLPFRWQQLNTELGSESTFSKVAFDKAILSVGNVGVHLCNGINVERIDQKIPDEVFKIHNGNDGPQRVYGIRDFYNELVYWTFPDFELNPTFPNRILVYNYQNQSWAFFKDTFTALGYFQRTDDFTWATLPYETWDTWTDPWNSGAVQSQFLSIIAGNQQGWTVLLDRDKSDNEAFYQISQIANFSSGATSTTMDLTIVDHNFAVGDYFLIENSTGLTSINGQICQVTAILTANSVSVIIATGNLGSGTYTGAATLRRVSGINLRTKRFNPYISTGSNFYLSQIDFFVEKTDNGEVSIDYFPNSSEYSVIDNDQGALLGTTILNTKAEDQIINSFETVQDKFWHRVYLMSEQFNLQIRIFLSGAQLQDWDIAREDFILHGMIIYTEREGRVQ